MPKAKKDFNNEDSSKEYKIQQLALHAQSQIMLCGECNEGYVETKDGMKICKCCENDLKEIKQLKIKDMEISIVNLEYEKYLGIKKEMFYFEPTYHICEDCNKQFQTKFKGRARCNDCFDNFRKDFIEAGKFFKEDIIKKI